jgi:hypothetical protein
MDMPEVIKCLGSSPGQFIQYPFISYEQNFAFFENPFADEKRDLLENLDIEGKVLQIFKTFLNANTRPFLPEEAEDKE